MNEFSVEKVLKIINDTIEDVDMVIEDADEDLMQLGLDSINFITLIVALEQAFMCEIPDEKLLFSEMNTVNKIFNVLQSIYTKN